MLIAPDLLSLLFTGMAVGTAPIVTIFNPAEDGIEILFDPALTPDPAITVTDFVDGTGASIENDANVELRVISAQELAPSVILTDITTLAAPV